MTRPSGCCLCVRFSLCERVCVSIRMDGNLDVIREVFVCPVRVVPSPRNNFLTTDVLYNQCLITVDHGSASFECNVMQELTHTRSVILFHRGNLKSLLSLHWAHKLLRESALYIMCTDRGDPGWTCDPLMKGRIFKPGEKKQEFVSLLRRLRSPKSSTGVHLGLKLHHSVTPLSQNGSPAYVSFLHSFIQVIPLSYHLHLCVIDMYLLSK